MNPLFLVLPRRLRIIRGVSGATPDPCTDFAEHSLSRPRCLEALLAPHDSCQYASQIKVRLADPSVFVNRNDAHADWIEGDGDHPMFDSDVSLRLGWVIQIQEADVQTSS